MNIEQIIYWIAAGAIPVVFAITLHEVAHGWVAYRLGDSTAKMLGRLSLNPIKHIDPVGTVIVPFALLTVSILTMGSPWAFGWAKPVPVSSRAFKNSRRSMALVAVAGPLSNFFMAAFWMLVWSLLNINFDEPSNLLSGFVTMTEIGIIFNLVLMAFNLLPIPPLDGGRVLSNLLPLPASRLLDRIEPYGLMILMALMLSNVLVFVLRPLIDGAQYLLLSFFSIVF